MSSLAQPQGVRRLAVCAISVALAFSGVALVGVAAQHYSPGALPLQLPWWVLLLAYFAALQRPIVYELNQHARITTLTQLPLAIGLVFLDPHLHLLVSALAAFLYVALRRLPLIKACYNVSLAMAEVGLASAVVSLFGAGLEPGARLWLALLTACVVVDVMTNLVIRLVLNLVGAPQQGKHLGVTVATEVATSAVFSSLGVLAVATIWTDAAIIVVIAALGSGLALAFGQHRRVAQQVLQQSQLQQFMKGLGPVDLDDPASLEVLEHVRVLLYAERLELAVLTDDSWRRVSTSQGTASLGEVAVPPLALELLDGAVVSPDDYMSTPLVGSLDLVGILTVRDRLGNVRKFGMRDLRLLEVVAAELAKALERGQLQRALQLAATTDPLTNLPNLNETSRLLDELLAQHPSGVVVAAMAVDSFREVNDTLGHQVGDELLCEVARRLLGGYPGACVGRIGGGRFAVALPSSLTGSDPGLFGLRIRSEVEGGAQLSAVGTHIRLSVGCVRAPDHGTDGATLIRRAETAMYSARHSNGGPVTWEPAYEIEGQRRLAVVMALREALSSGAIGVAFQPKVSAHSGEVTGVEALARWTHPALGAVTPAEFVPLAEAAGLMGPLTTTVLSQALTACHGWQRRGGRIGVAVNVSADTILDPSFVTEVAALLASINLAPDLLTLELTEGVVVHDAELAVTRMTEMRALGVKISVDDFGTGYSSLTYLKGLPVDEVKIDKGFVDDLTTDAADRAVVRAVVEIAHALGLRVVAEGVEHHDQDVLLAQLGVDEVQGYLHAKPMPAFDMGQWLRRREETSRRQEIPQC